MKKIPLFSVILMLLTVSVYAQIEFEASAEFNISPTGDKNPYSMKSGDFNNDGLQDIVVGNFSSSSEDELTILINNGSGGFTITGLDASGTIISVDTADLNNDGNLDVVAAIQGGDALGIFLGDGTGGFSLTETPAGDGPNFIGTGDFNEDGNPDVVIVNRFSDDMSFYLGDGTGAMNTPTTIAVNTNARCLSVADFNNDNHLDVLVGANADLDFYAGDGAGNLAAALTTTGFFGFRFMSAVDYNADGDLDLIVSESSFTYRLTGNGDGTFTLGSSFPEGQQVNSFGDFNKDGNMDVVTQDDLRIIVYLGNGFGAFPVYRRTYVDNGGFALTTGDWDNDGNLDVAVAGSSFPEKVTVSYGDGMGFFRGPTEYRLFPTSFAMEMTDLNNDGEMDIIAGSAGDMNIYFGDGAGRFNPGLSFNAGTAWSIKALHFNSDSNIDIAVLDIAGGRVDLHRGDGTGALALAGGFAVTAEQNMTTGDVNKDNITDIILSGAGGNIQIYRGNGDETFTLIQDLTVGDPVYSTLVEDINEDTNPDLIYVVDPSTPGPYQARFFQGDGAGNFSPAGTPLDLIQGGQTLFSGDVDNNGHIDFISVGNGADPDILIGDGTFSFTINTRSGAVGSLDEGVFADLNGDGNLDMVLGSSIGGFAAYSGAGDGTFPVYEYRLLGAGGYRIIPGDFNSDGIPDLATLTSGGSQDAFGVHLNSTIPPVCVPVQITSGPASTTLCEGDIRSLTVATTGDTPITYQWQKDGSDVTGATGPTLTLSSITPGDAGSYVCLVNNACGTDSSTPAVITVNTAPAPPTATGGTGCGFGSVTLTASGASDGQFRWYDAATGGTQFAGEVNSTFSTPGIDATTPFWVSINDGTCESSRTQVFATILLPVSITTQPQSQTVNEDDQVTFTVVANGDNLAYQWQFNGSDISGATSDQLIIPAVTFSDAGTYSCLVSNSCSSEQSTDAILTLNGGAVGFSVIDTEGNVTLDNGQQEPVDMGQASLSSTISRDFDIENTSANTLLINTITSSSNLFTIMNIPPSVPAFDFETFTVEFTGTSPGSFNTNVRINTDAGIFSFSIEAEIIDPAGDLVIFDGFAPDGDGRNDFFKIENIENFPDNRVRIFNRWGTEVFSVSGYENQNSSSRFEGRSNVGSGKDLVEGTYFYIIEYEGNRLSGSLFLRR